MDQPAQDKEFVGRMQQLEALLRDLESLPDPTVRAKMAQAVQGLMDFHGEGLSRILHQLQASGEMGHAMVDAFASDEVISSLMLLYGIHPQDLETRVKLALEKVRPYLQSHGGNVELLAVEDGIVRLAMQGSCHGCPSSAATLKSSIEESIYEKAPDVVEIAVEGVVPPPPVVPSGFVPIERLTTHAKQGVIHEDLQAVAAAACACGGH